MTDAIVKIVARRKHVVRHRRQRFRRHISRRKLAGRLSLPIPVRLMQLFLCLVRNIERICRPCLHRLKFSLQPFPGKLRISLAASWCDRCRTHDQLLIPNDDRDIVQNMLKRFCAPDDHRFVFRLLIGLCDQHGSRSFNFRHFSVEMLHQSGDPLALRNCLRIILHFLLPPSLRFLSRLISSIKPHACSHYTLPVI